MKRFKSKTTLKRGKFFFLIFLGVLSFAVTLSFFSSLFQKENVLEFLMETTLFSKQNTVKKTTLMDYLLNYTIGEKKEEEQVDEPVVSEPIEEESPKEETSLPIVYLYNSHQTEEYVGENNNDYNVTPTIWQATHKLKEELKKRNIESIVEDASIEDIIYANGWDYEYSYVASKMLMTDALEKNPSLEYFIDLHRDALPYESSTLFTEEKNYAKFLFVIGIDNETYEQNMALAEKVSDALNAIVPGISKGIYKRGGSGPKAIYNQNFSTKTILIEIGAQYNKISEVNNSIIVLAEALERVMKSE